MELTLDYLKSQLRYDPDSGNFYRLSVPAKARLVTIGEVAGHLDKTEGYVVIGICSRVYKAHRLAWFYMTGQWPSGPLDHRDLNKANNKWSNLRQATYSQNGMNRKVRAFCTSGAKGVSKVRNRFRAYIAVGGKNKHLGYFSTKEEAMDAYAKAALVAHGDFACVG